MNKYQDADILKLFFLSTHYSHSIDYTEVKINEAKKQRKIFNEFFDKVHLRVLKPEGKNNPFSEKDKTWIDDICAKFRKAMNDNFNTPQALGYLFELIDAGNGFISSDKQDASLYVVTKIEEFFSILGLRVKPHITMPQDVEKLICKRDEARKRKDFKQSDEIRKEIELLGYLVVDTSSTIRLIEKEPDEL